MWSVAILLFCSASIKISASSLHSSQSDSDLTSGLFREFDTQANTWNHYVNSFIRIQLSKNHAYFNSLSSSVICW